MTNKLKFTIVFPDKGKNIRFLSRSHVHVQYDFAFSRRSNAILDNQIEDFKRNFVTSSNLYDGRNFRLAGLDCKNEGLTLQIGPTFYLDYLALRTIKENDRSIMQDEVFLPNVIGNVGILLTSDGKSFCVLRSQQVSTYRGYLDFPGGHPEPVHIDNAEQQPSKKQETDYNLLVRDELFDAVTRETIEDLGVENLSLHDPLLFAIVLNNDDILKPDMVFIITTTHTSKDVHECFYYRKSRHYEVADIISIDFKNLNSVNFGHAMTPIMEGALHTLRKLSYYELEKQLFAAKNKS